MKIFPTLLISISVLLSGCSGCSKSGQKHRLSHQSDQPDSRRAERPKSGEKTLVKMEKLNGVYQIPVEVDGVEMYFIFDTGAGMISISNTEVNFLIKQGKLRQEDVIGSANFMDANGDISVGTIISLKTVKIGDRTLHDVHASVVDNLDAPLLMGQSALEQFGKISIDYKRGVIEFE
jgi:aspartyl protease family protein